MSSSPSTQNFEALWTKINTMADIYATKTDLAQLEVRFERNIGDLKNAIGKLQGELSTVKKVGYAVLVSVVGAVILSALNLI